MGLKLGGLLKMAAPIAAGMIPGIGPIAGPLAAAVVGGMGSKKSSKNAFADVLRAARPNQSNAQGDQLTWTTDPKTGQAVQSVAYSPERQAQFDAFNRIATGRMGKAEGMTAGLPTGAIDYDKMGLGSLAAAGGIGQGKTGKRPWADSEYSSLGGDALNYLQFSEGQGGLTPAQTWGSRPIGAPPSGGGAALAPPPPAPAPSGGGGMIGNMMGGPETAGDPIAAQKQAMMAEELRKRTQDQIAAGTGV